MLHKELYRPSTTLAEDIAQITSPRQEASPVDIANIVTKYFVEYVIDGRGNTRIPYSQVEYIFENAHPVLSGNPHVREHDFFTSAVGTAKYALTMLGDVAATTQVCEEILHGWSRKSAGKTKQKVVHILDLGSGSWILLLMGHIRALRSGKSVGSATGLEWNWTVAQRSHALLSALSVGQVTRADTTKIASYPETPPDIILNENLSRERVPLYYGMGDVQYEPFLRNIHVMDRLYGEAIGHAYMFPRLTRLSFSDHEIEMPFGLRHESPEHMLWKYFDKTFVEPKWFRSVESQEAEALRNLSRTVSPLSLAIGRRLLPLSEIGRTYRSYAEAYTGDGKIVNQIHQSDRRW